MPSLSLQALQSFIFWTWFQKLLLYTMLKRVCDSPAVAAVLQLRRAKTA